MKNLTLLFVGCVTLLSVLSCSQEDDGAYDLERKWQYSKYGYSLNSEDFLFDYEHTSGCIKDYIVFTNNTTSEHNFSGSMCEETIDNDTYTRSGNVLTSSSGETLEIIYITSTSLKLKYIPEDDDDEVPAGAYGILTFESVN